MSRRSYSHRAISRGRYRGRGGRRQHMIGPATGGARNYARPQPNFVGRSGRPRRHVPAPHGPTRISGNPDNPATVRCGQTVRYTIKRARGKWHPRLTLSAPMFVTLLAGRCARDSATTHHRYRRGAPRRRRAGGIDTQIFGPCRNDDYGRCGPGSRCSTRLSAGTHTLNIGNYGSHTGTASFRIVCYVHTPTAAPSVRPTMRPTNNPTRMPTRINTDYCKAMQRALRIDEVHLMRNQQQIKTAKVHLRARDKGDRDTRGYWRLRVMQLQVDRARFQTTYNQHSEGHGFLVPEAGVGAGHCASLRNSMGDSKCRQQLSTYSCKSYLMRNSCKLECCRRSSSSNHSV